MMVRMSLVGRFLWVAGVSACVLGSAMAASAESSASRGAAFAAKPFRLGAAPVAVAASGGAVWVVVEQSDQQAALWKVDPQSGKRLAAFRIGKAGPDFGAVTATQHAVYAAAGRHLLRVSVRDQRILRARLDGEAAAITAGSASVSVATVGARNADTRFTSTSLTAQARVVLTVQPVALQTWRGSVWMASTSGLWRVVADRLVPARLAGALPVAVATRQDKLWLLQQDEQIIAIDRRGSVRERLPLPFPPDSFAVAQSRIWVTNNCGCNTGEVALLDLNGQTRIVRIGRTLVAIAATLRSAWVASFGDETLWRLTDPS